MKSVQLADLNAADRERFVELAGHVVEASPWVAEEAADARPFASKAELHAAFCRALETGSESQQLAVIRAHPDLGARLASLGEASAKEQRNAGLAALTDVQREQLRELNEAYRVKFGFPFILAVKGASHADILASFEARLPNDLATERATALAEIERIIANRIDDLLA